MKKIIAIITLILSLMLCTACGTKTWDEHYELGTAAMTEKNYDDAVKEFTAAIEMDETKSEAFMERANAYVAKGDAYEEAVADFEQVLKLDSKSTDAYMALADIYWKRGNEEQLHKVLNFALENVTEDDLKTVLEYINGLSLKEKQRIKILTIKGDNKKPLYNLEKKKIMAKFKKQKAELEKQVIGYWLTRSYGNWCYYFRDNSYLVQANASPSGGWSYEYRIHYNENMDKNNDFDISKLDKKLYLTTEDLTFEDNAHTGEFYTTEIRLIKKDKLVIGDAIYTRYGSFDEIFKAVGKY